VEAMFPMPFLPSMGELDEVTDVLSPNQELMRELYAYVALALRCLFLGINRLNFNWFRTVYITLFCNFREC
jgi:hypothetical protein